MNNVILDNLTNEDMARMVTVWLYRLAQDDDLPVDVNNAADAVIEGAEQLRSLIELQEDDR